MTERPKSIDRLLSKPTDFEWAELKTLLENFGYDLKMVGGSGRKFIHQETKAVLFIHEPHPGRILKACQVREVIRFLKQEGPLI